MTSTPSPEMDALKARLKTTWESGDYAHFAQYLERGALEFLDRLDIAPGTRLLDIGCGAGQLTIPAAKRGIDVTGVDLAQNLVDTGNERAKSEGLGELIKQGDAEALQFEDDSFDIVLSLIGSMFAPRPELVASEMLRVTKPGGKAIMGNWTADGHVGQMFKLIGKYAPPPSIFPSPLMWGNPEKVQERFGEGVSDLRCTTYMYPMVYPFGPAEVADFFIEYYGPTNRMFAGLGSEKQAEFREEFAALWKTNNTATDGTTFVPSEYIEVVATVR